MLDDFDFSKFKQSTLLFKNFKFYNQFEVDSAFYVIVDINGSDFINTYEDEFVKRESPRSDKYVILQFFYSLEVFNAVCYKRDIDANKLGITRDYFFKNIKFKERYSYKSEFGNIVVENLDKLYLYNFKHKIKVEYVNSTIELLFPESNCKIILPPPKNPNNDPSNLRRFFNSLVWLFEDSNGPSMMY
jgi:hypothetical protein